MRSAAQTIWLSDATCFHTSDAVHLPFGCGPVCLLQRNGPSSWQSWLCGPAARRLVSACAACGSNCLLQQWLCLLAVHRFLHSLSMSAAHSFPSSMAKVAVGFVADQRQDPLPQYVLAQEFDIVKQAFYTEPHDQSSWLYLRWLLSNSLTRWQRAKGTPAEADARQVSLSAAACATSACRPNVTVGHDGIAASLMASMVMDGFAPCVAAELLCGCIDRQEHAPLQQGRTPRAAPSRKKHSLDTILMHSDLHMYMQHQFCRR